MPRRYYRSPLGRILFLVLLATIVAVRFYQLQKEPSPPDPLREGVEYEVERVVDGDTLLLTNHACIRLLGIDTPETKKKNHPVEPWGLEATEYTEHFIAEVNHRIQLEFDKDRIDPFGRMLAYVYGDGRFLNEELVRSGLARVPNYGFTSAMRRKLRKVEDEAKANCRGIWSRNYLGTENGKSRMLPSEGRKE
ncbi:MAG: thermonuclease family protein [Pirellulales bacterium]|nr:thermonuclease family protein [Pirellulales bacterium]